MRAVLNNGRQIDLLSPGSCNLSIGRVRRVVEIFTVIIILMVRGVIDKQRVYPLHPHCSHLEN